MVEKERRDGRVTGQGETLYVTEPGRSQPVNDGPGDAGGIA